MPEMTSTRSDRTPQRAAKALCAPHLPSSRPSIRRGRVFRALSLRKVGRIAFLPLAFAAIAFGSYWILRSNTVEDLMGNAERLYRNLMVSSGLTVSEVVVTGRRNTQHSDIAMALAVSQGDLLFEVLPRSARERIEALGWVRSATVRRQFPDTVLINIVERRPFALWQRDGRLSLIDREGQVISSKDLAAFNGLPAIVGEDAPQHVGALVAILARKPTLLAQLDAATRVSGRRWNIRLQSGMDIRLPQHGVAEAWDLLASLIAEHRLLERDVIAIDLRVKDRLAMRLGPASAATRRGEGRNT